MLVQLYVVGFEKVQTTLSTGSLGADERSYIKGNMPLESTTLVLTKRWNLKQRRKCIQRRYNKPIGTKTNTKITSYNEIIYIYIYMVFTS